MTIEQAQAQVDQWIKTTGVRYFNELTNTAILMESWGGCPDHVAQVWRAIV
jgi:hypothetical protein